MASIPANGSASEAKSPRYQVPARSLMALEHPCLVKNVDKAIKMVGGSSAVAQSLAKGPGNSLSLSFHPEDPASRPVVSHHNKTCNILLRVTVPRRTGRRRKRGSNGPFLEEPAGSAPPKDARYLLRTLQDNPKSYDMTPVGTIPSTHVWRNMPDFVYSTADSAFLNDIREKILPLQLPLLKQYSLPRTYGLTNTEIIPPAVLSHHTIPHNYGYRHNPAVKLITTDGTKSIHNSQSRAKNHTISCSCSAVFPTKPSPHISPLSQQTVQYCQIVSLLQKLFHDRPLWTKRALINSLPASTPLFVVRYALAHVAFNIRSGPFRDATCAIGVDPRTDPKYCIYQTVLLQLFRGPQEDRAREEAVEDDYSRRWTRSPDVSSHIFTGEGRVPIDGKCWMLCDIIDPQFLPLINMSDVDPECEIRTRGYYPNGAWAKLKTAMKVKVEAMQKGTLEEDKEQIELFLRLPNDWDPKTTTRLEGTFDDGYLPADSTDKALKWASLYRASCRTWAKEKEMEARQAARDRGVVADSEIGLDDTRQTSPGLMDYEMENEDERNTPEEMDVDESDEYVEDEAAAFEMVAGEQVQVALNEIDGTATRADEPGPV